MSKSSKVRGLAAIVAVAALTVAVGACSDTKFGAQRNSSGTGCQTRFGCSASPTTFTIRNDTDGALSFIASRFEDVESADQDAIAQIDVPAHSTSSEFSVRLGDDGLRNDKGYVRGGERGWWTWRIVNATTSTEARVGLALNRDEWIMEGWSQIGPQHGTSQASEFQPVILKNASGVNMLSGVGSHQEVEDVAPTMTWTFAPLAP